MSPGASHEGVWHAEGRWMDKISASAVHYLEVGEGIKGGNLRFRPFQVSYGTFGNTPMHIYNHDFEDYEFNDKLYSEDTSNLVSKKPFITHAASAMTDTYLKNSKAGPVDFEHNSTTNSTVVFNNIELR